MRQDDYEFSPWINEDFTRLAALTKGAQRKAYKKETSLYSICSMPEYVYLIVRGRVRVTAYHHNGKERQLYIAERGSIVGETSAILNRMHTTTASAIVDTEVYQISVTQFKEAMKQDYELSNAIMQMVCRKHDILFQALLSSTFSQSLQQIAQILLNLVDQYGEQLQEGCRISIRFTHQDIANITGISRVTVSNVLNLMIEKGICGKINGKFVIYDMERLRSYTRTEE